MNDFGPQNQRLLIVSLRGPVSVMLLFTALLLQSATAGAQASPSAIDLSASRGSVVERVACQGDPAQSYALYLPSQYTPAKRWPIIYAFDPGARGKTPVELYRTAAEKYGYIVVGSNNSRNGPMSAEGTAAKAMWEDTHQRLAIDDRRVYTTGLSGGARFATSFALYCNGCNIAGVIAHGAGYPPAQGPPVKENFAYYAAVGDADFNLPELLSLREKKDAQGASFRIRVYPGTHQWAPPDVVEDAITWMELKAMQSGARTSDATFIEACFAKTQKEAEEAAQRGDSLAQYYAVRSLATDFKGLRDVSQFETELAQLRESGAFKKAAHDEHEEIARQESLTGKASLQLSQLAQANFDDVSPIKEDIASTLRDLHRRADAKSDDYLLYTRAFNQLWLETSETGQDELQNNHLRQAAAYFEILAQAAPERPAPLLILAEVRLREGNRKAALKSLQEAVKRGLPPGTLKDNAQFAALAGDPEFQKIVQAAAGN